MYLSEKGLDLLEKMLCYDPAKRISAAQALKHPWFQEEPRATDHLSEDVEQGMPRFAALNEMSRE